MINEDEDIDGLPRFKLVYMCLEAYKRGFIQSCRPFVAIDGYHIKGPKGGHILVAVGVGSYNSMFPIAYAVIKAESRSSWIWFLTFFNASPLHQYLYTWVDFHR